VLEFGEEGGKFFIRLFKAEEFRAGILYTVQVSIGMFENLQNFRVVVELADTALDVRQDLRVRSSWEAAIYVGHARERSRESV
jgi:hypothetical protein